MGSIPARLPEDISHHARTTNMAPSSFGFVGMFKKSISAQGRVRVTMLRVGKACNLLAQADPRVIALPSEVAYSSNQIFASASINHQRMNLTDCHCAARNPVVPSISHLALRLRRDINERPIS